MNRSMNTAGIFFLACLISTGGYAEPKGYLLIIGGGDRPPAVTQKFIELSGGNEAKIVVIPMASSVPDTSGKEVADEFKALGVKSAEYMIFSREQAMLKENAARLQGASGIYFSGGDQSRLTERLLGTAVLEKVKELYHDGAMVAGTSAGAAVMSKIMITGDERYPVKDSSFNTIEEGNIVTTEGFGFVEGVVIDQHFVMRKRCNRLISVILEHPNLIGIGIDESTAILVKPDHTFEVIGDGPIIVIDPTNGTVVKDRNDRGLRGDGIRLQVLRDGSLYDITTRTVTRLGNW